jgi:hypothetical protein
MTPRDLPGILENVIAFLRPLYLGWGILKEMALAVNRQRSDIAGCRVLLTPLE